MAGLVGASAEHYSNRQVIWRILPSKAKMMEKEKSGTARMFVDEEGALRADCDELSLAVSIKPPANSRFEFSEPLTGVDVNAHSVAKLKHGSSNLFSSSRFWTFYLVVESCECKLLSNKSKKQQAVDISTRSVGFAQDVGGRKVIVFKEDGRMSPIFEFELPGSICLIARGPAAVAAPPVAQALGKLATVDPLTWVAPHLHRKSTSEEVDLLGLNDDSASTTHAPMHTAVN